MQQPDLNNGNSQHDSLKAAVEKLIDETTAGILIEPVQGEGGVRDVGTEFLRALRALCDEKGILLGFDEVQCGIGRTGKLFAHEWAGVTPDVMAIAKGIGGGFPLGAVLTTKAVGSAMQPRQILAEINRAILHLREKAGAL
ncbi:MAG: aminotransferase class III-fold pyridoxal phosphate-dependent enzyme, partial [Alphaproteobacteria bacterium]|nr:aminotransferase class III-fold pyridoxal phosphate-dependent enzyme [Alphaproteobacteria bacterium]